MTASLLTNTINLVQTEDAQFGGGGASIAERPWYFSNGVRYPKPVRINKKTNKRLAKLIPSEDPRRDRITNQLMFVPHNYEEIKESGKLKTILLYNGLGPWNVKNGEFSSGKRRKSRSNPTFSRPTNRSRYLYEFKVSCRHVHNYGQSRKSLHRRYDTLQRPLFAYGSQQTS